jgi:N-acyl-D-aspartate/D-glutamate deacylase
VGRGTPVAAVIGELESVMDIVVRGGTVYDGTGADGVIADVGIKDGVVVAIGRVAERGAEEIDAEGCIVTPGFVDIHTHYDGQAIWDDTLAPSSLHGVTTVVMGNCGVGFAPCRASDRERLIALMEGVEDIPGAVMAEGLTWEWESFEEYLTALDARKWDVDVCALLPHAPLRVFVMGQRALDLEPATGEDIAEMRVQVARAISAGAFGVSSSRTTAHRAVNGDYMPTLRAREAEVTGLLRGMQDAGRGFFEVVTEMRDREVLMEYRMIAGALASTGQRAVFSLSQPNTGVDMWREILAFADETIAAGVSMRPVIAPRPVGLLLGLESSLNPFSGTRTYRSIADLPLAERVAAMRKTEVRAAILADDPMEFTTFSLLERTSRDNMFRLGNPPVYAPNPNDSLAAIAQREGRTAAEVAYDVLLEDDGMGFIMIPLLNYFDSEPERLRVCEELLSDPNTIMGLGDGGAHVGFILDAGFQTFLLAYWVKERGRFSIAEAVRRMTSDTADAAGLSDRGRIRVGLKGDLNIIDFDHLGYSPVSATRDLPCGGKRLMQHANGFRATIVSGQVTYRDGQPTMAKPGRLVRSGTTSPRGAE